MIAAIPATKAGAGGASTVFKHWPWIAGVTLIFIAASGVLYSWHMFSNSNSSAASTENPSAVGSSTAGKEAPATSKAVQQYEKIVSVDPYNADAWFALAKAQADVHRSLDAISSAQKALDVARARNRSDLAGTIEAWLRSYHGTQSGRSTP
jgi:predicted negative regulator of RcsB-dependent stress response